MELFSIRFKTWEKSNHRILFIGADPNGAKAHNIKDMG